MFTVVNTRHTIDDLQGLPVWPRYPEELSKLTRKYLVHHFQTNMDASMKSWLRAFVQN